jgi:homoserine O-acetyltransferase/O-succinyltransferase
MPTTIFNIPDDVNTLPMDAVWEGFTLESGIVLPGFHLTYTAHGQLHEKGDNVVWIFHALTANSDPAEWWPGLVGDGKLFDPSGWFIICVNMPGSCYGSIGPLDVNSQTGEPWYHQFPFFTTRDMIRAYRLLKDALGIRKIRIGIGGSMGGQQLLEWAIEEPELFDYIFPVATNAFHSPWAIAFNATQRHAIEGDATWTQKSATAGLGGMRVARGIALISYRHYETYQAAQAEEIPHKIDQFKSESYQRYQGDKLVSRFNAFSYYFLSKSMDAHNVARSRSSVQEALQRIRAKTLVIGISSDILFPPREQEFLARHIPGAAFITIDSNYGHDGFLLEFDQLETLIRDFVGDGMVVKGELSVVTE